MLKSIGKSLKSQSLPKGRSEWDWRRQPQENAAEHPLTMSGGMSAARPPATRLAGGMGPTLPAGPNFDFNLPDGYLTAILDGETRPYPELDARIDELYGGGGADNADLKEFMAAAANAFSREGACLYAVTLLGEEGYPPPPTQIRVYPVREPIDRFLERLRDRGLQVMKSSDEFGDKYRASHVELGLFMAEYVIQPNGDNIYHVIFSNKHLDMRRELLGNFCYLIEGITPRAEII